MAIRAFIRETVVVRVSATSRVVVRKPSCVSVLMAANAFDVEIRALWRTWKALGGGLGPDPLGVALPQFLGSPDRLIPILVSAAALHGGTPGDLEYLLSSRADVREAILKALLSVTDIGAVAFNLSLDMAEAKSKEKEAPEATEEPPDGIPEPPSPLEFIVWRLSEKYGVPPMEIMEWPFEAVMAIMRAISTPGHGAPAPKAAGLSQIASLFPEPGMVAAVQEGDGGAKEPICP